MPFLSREQIDPSLRSQGEGSYRAQLRQMLSNPTLSPEQRAALKRRIAEVGQARFYDANSPPPVGAISVASNKEV